MPILAVIGDSMGLKVLYFAYGSNMKTNRLCKRIPSAKPVGRGKIFNKRLVCNKRSKDSSGKANLEDSPRGVVWGVLYEMNSSDLKRLDEVEGGYHRTTMYVQTDEDEFIAAEVYISTDLTPKAIPFDWYKELMVSGAREHQLPKVYVEFLKKLPYKCDPRRVTKF